MMPEIVTCFGQDWERDCVTWKEMPELLGRQVNSTQALNFAGQTGIYLLQQDLRIIYVGSTGELTLGDCLHKHAEDRLMDWNAFSFFGFVPLRDDGSFGVLPAKFTAQDVIAAMKFVLVISARPDKRDASECNFGAIEFFRADTGEYLKGQQFLA